MPRRLRREMAPLGTLESLHISMSRFIHKSHNVSVLLYHLVFVAKYRRVVIDETVDSALREVCLELALRYEVDFLEIGTDGDHVHFLV